MGNNKRRLKREDKELMINIFNELMTSIRCTEKYDTKNMILYLSF